MCVDWGVSNQEAKTTKENAADDDVSCVSFYVCYWDGALYPNALTRPTVQHGTRRTTQAVWLPLLDMAWVSKFTTAGNGIFDRCCDTRSSYPFVLEKKEYL